ncbi:hypothetical protein AN641_09450 [Candidatus Epulonipiscioides gigas]|nr:hypothetical protein AN641_09450 [Epulopiscium sp. SCG-C07WGA-EpuloA2]
MDLNTKVSYDEYIELAYKMMSNTDKNKLLTLSEQGVIIQYGYNNNLSTIELSIFTLSYLHDKTQDIECLTKILQLCATDELTLEQKIYLYFQVGALIGHLGLRLSSDFYFPIYANMYNEFEILVKKTFDFLPYKIDEQSPIIVTTEQLAGLNRGPSKNFLDHVYTLATKFKRPVIIVFTAERCNRLNLLINTRMSNYIVQSQHIAKIKLPVNNIEIDVIHGATLDFSIYKLVSLVDLIYQLKPYLVYNMQAESLVSDACKLFTNVSVISFSYDIPVSEAPNLILGRKLLPSDKKIFDLCKQNNQYILESTFTFILTPIEKCKTRQEYNLENDNIVIAIVGHRLDSEINNHYKQLLERLLTLSNKIKFLFIGIFENYEQVLANTLILEHSLFIGNVPNLLEVYPICNLFLNPIRPGGGTSAVEALVSGIPVVTLSDCDVAYACGSKFTCQNEAEYIETVNRYIIDKSFYIDQSIYARTHGQELLDTETALRKMLYEIKKRSIFKKKRSKHHDS